MSLRDQRSPQVKKMAPGYQLAILVFVALFLLGGCATKRSVPVPLASIEGVNAHFGVGRIVSLKTEKSIAFETLIDQLKPIDIIFIGEVHDNAEHHLIQVQILQALIARYGPVTVAMEVFQEPQQSIIDDYIDGGMTEEVFLKDVDWRKQWGLDYLFYRPLVVMVKEHGGSVLAINVPRKIVKNVAKGGLKSLKPEERQQVADVIDLDNKQHRAYLREVYEGHPRSNLKGFDYFYQAQCVWEDTMAENIAEYLKENQEKQNKGKENRGKENEKTVVFTGNGHISHKFGIPERTIKRIPLTMATIVLSPLSERMIINKEVADYVWLTGDYHRKRRMMRPKKQSNQTGSGGRVANR